MSTILNADDVKPDFVGLKKKWNELLKKYFVADDILNQEFTIQVLCPHCGDSSVKFQFSLNGFNHNSCDNCETLYVSPRLNDNCIEELYSDDYYSEMYTRSMLPIFDKRKKLIGKSKYSQTVDIWGGNRTGFVLDIGAGIGEVTDVFQDAGWSSHAIEMNRVAVDWLKTRNHTEVFHGTLDQYTAPIEGFDIIMAWGVIEHVLEPDLFLKKVFNLLAPGGVFVSEVPHGKSFLVDMSRKMRLDPKRILMGEQHIVLYSTNAYLDLHSRNGFALEKIQTNGLDMSTIFKELGLGCSDLVIAAMQESIDENMYGDLLRGFWRKPKPL
jgi:2-polyprenyl-3-methyl-5-hydroxy-6-metoxy-1,4-benzoquinol methylase